MTEPVPGRDIPGDPAPESRFSGPTDLCPHPENWHSTDGDSSEIEVSKMIGGLILALQPRIVIETGAGFGQTTETIVKAMLANGQGTFVTYESDLVRSAEVISRLKPLGPFESIDVHVVAKKAIEEQTPFALPIDFAFFDSFYEERVPEFNHFYRWMRPGTIVAFHDTAPGHGRPRLKECGITWIKPLQKFMDADPNESPDLQEWIEWELVRKGMIRVIRFPTPRGITIGEVLL